MLVGASTHANRSGCFTTRRRSTMNMMLVVVLQLLFQQCLADLFTVEAEQTAYMSEFGGDVVMGCKFKPLLSDPHSTLRVTWQWSTQPSDAVLDVYRLDNGEERTASQDPRFRGRVRLLREGLRDGLVQLQVSKLQIKDSGTYRCLVQTGDGADYKEMALTVTAPYKTVTKHIQTLDPGGEALLTCRSRGFPAAAVEWRAANGHRLSPNTTSVSTPERLIQVSSKIRVSSSVQNNYTCTFGNDGASATFLIPDEILPPGVKNKALVIALVIVPIVVAAIGVIVYQKQKGSGAPAPRNPLIGGLRRILSAFPCLKITKEEGELKPFFNEDCNEKNLGVFLKAHYSNTSFREKQGCNGDAASVESLTQRLHKNEDRPVILQDLIPEAGGKFLLEGPTGSGKTTIAHILVSSWAVSPKDSAANLLDPSMLCLLLYIDCAAAKGDLFEEITTQLSLGEGVPSGDDLRNLLSKSHNSLLLLDGYREGCHVFDESLRGFLSERGDCRVLVTSCPGHCPTLKDTFDPKELLSLQTQTAKY